VIDDLLRGLNTHIGADQNLEQLVEKRLIDKPPLGLKQVTNVRFQELRCFFQPLFDAV
jgi:hypothetical protein